MIAQQYFILVPILAGCATLHPTPDGPPPTVLGQFEDDYAIPYSISSTEWVQASDARYRIVHWDPDGQFLIAHNDAANESGAGLWTRIDWVELDSMPPYTWAFCYTVYDAPTRAAAEATPPADRSTPRTGCNGYPFSRMKRAH